MVCDTRQSPGWDPVQYARFEAERDRAAFDLIARLPADLNPRIVWDLGCGAGQHAAFMARRWREAAVHGMDSSPAMIDQARARPEPVRWSVGDLTTWSLDAPVDLIFTNAALQWVSDHEALFPRLTAQLAPGGVLACQMPMAHETLHHQLMRETAGEGPWSAILADVATIAPLLAPGAYFDRLSTRCRDIDLWSTTYFHVLDGADPVLEWMKGTALRPYLMALASRPDLSEAFLADLGARLADAFPAGADGRTLLPFPRLFLVARRAS